MHIGTSCGCYSFSTSMDIVAVVWFLLSNTHDIMHNFQTSSCSEILVTQHHHSTSLSWEWWVYIFHVYFCSINFCMDCYVNLISHLIFCVHYVAGAPFLIHFHLTCRNTSSHLSMHKHSRSRKRKGSDKLKVHSDTHIHTHTHTHTHTHIYWGGWK